MPFRLSSDELRKNEVCRLINKGLFWSLVYYDDCRLFRSFRTLKDAKRAKTRKLRVVRTAHLLQINFTSKNDG